VASGFTLTFIV